MPHTTLTPDAAHGQAAAPATDAGGWERILMGALYDPTIWLGERLGMARRRRRLLSEATGRVLEIGAGTGHNARHWPDGLEDLVVTEPVPTLLPRIERRLARAGREAKVVAAGAESLPLEDSSVDTVVSTMVLCTVGDVAASLAEIRRVLRPGGRLLFIEHVRGEGRLRQKGQDLVHRGWRSFAAGCNCNLPTLDLLAASGFTVERVDRGRWRGMPFCVTPLVIGSATP